MDVRATGAMGMDIAVLVSATFNGSHFCSPGRGLPAASRARRAAAAALALVNAGLAVEALYPFPSGCDPRGPIVDRNPPAGYRCDRFPGLVVHMGGRPYLR